MEKILIPSAQYHRMSTEHQQYSFALTTQRLAIHGGTPVRTEPLPLSFPELITWTRKKLKLRFVGCEIVLRSAITV